MPLTGRVLKPRALQAVTRSLHATPSARGGGGAHPPYPAHVWTPAGGWWCNPPQWKRNSYIAGAIGLIGWGLTFSLSASIEVPRRHIRTLCSPSSNLTKHDHS